MNGERKGTLCTQCGLLDFFINLNSFKVVGLSRASTTVFREFVPELSRIKWITGVPPPFTIVREEKRGMAQRMAKEPHDSIETMASSYAQRAVELGREFDAALDFSENSIMELETILDQCAHHVRSDRPSDDDLTELCKTWGCYLGEVVRRRFGGEWSIETYPGKQFATLTLNIAGNKMYPSIKVHRRISQSAEENVWTFYKMVKQRLETPPRIQ